MAYRYQYLIGDLQGCFAALQALKDQLGFDEQQDCLYFAGDLVARGEDSLATLREVKRLSELGAANTVLGNHDLNLLAVWRGYQPLNAKDRTADIFAADDCDDLLNWLRQQPLLLEPNSHSVLVHAGIPPIWTLLQAKQYAREVQQVIAADYTQLDGFLSRMYGTEPHVWDSSLTGWERLRTITNYLTRMRLCDANGALDFKFKDDLNAPMPAGFKPWFEWPSQVAPHTQLFFGHWAALQGQSLTANRWALDGGCVWGGQLIAYRLEDAQRFVSSKGCGL